MLWARSLNFLNSGICKAVVTSLSIPPIKIFRLFHWFVRKALSLKETRLDFLHEQVSKFKYLNAAKSKSFLTLILKLTTLTDTVELSGTIERDF